MTRQQANYTIKQKNVHYVTFYRKIKLGGKEKKKKDPLHHRCEYVTRY
jgi:hypothetical protein